jgi:signal transduction histidine kinase
MIGNAVERQLLGAELWERGGDRGSARFFAGWEDGTTFCAAVCTTDLGLAFCRACPAKVAETSLRLRRAAADRCPAGVRLLAFPAPAGSGDQVAVLRVAPPSVRAAISIADQVRIASGILRRAARDAEPANAAASLAAARVLRNIATNRDWQVDQRARGADRRRAAAQALTQMLATSEELQALYREAKRQRRELDRSRRLIDRLARDTLRATDEERSRIAHEIHDTAAQSMVSAFRFLDAARAASAVDGRDPDPRLVNAGDLLLTAIREVRAVLARLMPPGLEELGIAEALRTRARSGSDGLSGNLTVVVTGDVPRLDGWVEQSIYGMASEAMSNAIRHGRATRIRVDLRVIRDRVLVTVTDDGIGFAAATVGRSDRGGLGLVGMARQASWLGGSARIVSRPGAGTKVRISIPLARHLRVSSVAATAMGAGDGTPPVDTAVSGSA